MEQIHEGNQSVKKVRLSNLRNEFGNFKLKEGETIKEAHARFQTIMNSLNQLGKPIPTDERNMKILSAVPWVYEPKVTALEASPLLDTMDFHDVFSELAQFETKINESKAHGSTDITSKMKNLALHANNSKPESDEESDEELALMSRKIKRMIEKRNKYKMENKGFSKGKKFSKESKGEQTCFECGKPGHYKKDCYKLKAKQPAVYKDRKKKSKALLTWSDNDDSESSDDTSEEMVNLALVGLDDDDSVLSHPDDGLMESDSEDDKSEVNSFKFRISSDNIVLEQLTMQEPKSVSIEEYNSVKAEIKDLKAKVEYLEAFNKILLKRGQALGQEVSELKAEIEDRDTCLESFKLSKSIEIETSQPTATTSQPAVNDSQPAVSTSQPAVSTSQTAEKIKSLETEVIKLRKGMGTFIQGEDGLKFMMKSINVPLQREGVGLNFKNKGKTLKYEGRKGKPYKYAMPWNKCSKCEGKGHLTQNCKVQNSKRAYQNEAVNKTELTRMKL